MEVSDNELSQSKIALSEARSIQETIEKDRDRLVEELARSEVKQQEYASIIEHNKKLAIAEIEAAKSLFKETVQGSISEKFGLESKLVLEKQEAVELAVQVEKLAELSFQQATSLLLEEAHLRVFAAKTAAAEAVHHIEEQIRHATEGTISSILDQSKQAICKALFAAEQASNHTEKAISASSGGNNLLDEIAAVRSQNL